MKRWIGALVLLSTSAGCRDVPTEPTQTVPVQAAAVAGGPVTISRSQGSYDYAGYTVDCSGRLVDMVGVNSWSYDVVQHPSGDWMGNEHSSVEMKGTVLGSSEKYIGHGQFNVTQVFAAPKNGAFTYTASYHMVGITQGSSDNSKFTVLAKWTIDATGKVAVENFAVEWECRG